MIAEMLVIAALVVVIFGGGMVVGISIANHDQPDTVSGGHHATGEDEQ